MNVITVTLMPRIIYTTWILINTLTRDPFNLGISAPKKVFRQTTLLSFQTYYFSVLPEKFSYTDQKEKKNVRKKKECQVGAKRQVMQINLGSVQTVKIIKNLDPKQANKQTNKKYFCIDNSF